MLSIMSSQTGNESMLQTGGRGAFCCNSGLPLHPPPPKKSPKPKPQYSLASIKHFQTLHRRIANPMNASPACSHPPSLFCGLNWFTYIQAYSDCKNCLVGQHTRTESQEEYVLRYIFLHTYDSSDTCMPFLNDLGNWMHEHMLSTLHV